MHDLKAEGIPVLFTWPSRGEVRLSAYGYDGESANYSRDALEQLLDTLAANPQVKEVNILAHSMGIGSRLKRCAARPLVVVRSEARSEMFSSSRPTWTSMYSGCSSKNGCFRPRFALFVSQDDKALGLSQWIWGGMHHFGEIHPEQEPYREILAQENIAVFDLTKMQGNAQAEPSTTLRKSC